MVLSAWLFPAEPLGNSHAPDLTRGALPVTGMNLFLQQHLPIGVPSKSKKEEERSGFNLFIQRGRGEKILSSAERNKKFPNLFDGITNIGGAVVSNVASQQEGSGFESRTLPVWHLTYPGCMPLLAPWQQG